MKKLVRAIALTLCVLLLLGSLCGCGRNSEPLVYLKDRAQYTLDESLGGELLAFLLQVMQNGSLSVNYEGSDLAPGLPESASLSLFMDAEGERIAAVTSLRLDGKQLDASFWLDNEQAVLLSPSLLGSNTLGIHFETLKNDLATSIFSNNSGTAYAQPNVTPSSADSAIAIKDGLFDLLGAVDTVRGLGNEATDLFLELLATNAQNTRYKEKGRTYVTLSVDNDALSRTLRETRAALVKDRAFCRDLRALAGSMDALQTAKTGVVSNAYTTKLEYFLTSEADIDAICLTIDNAPAFQFKLNATVRNFGGKLEDLSFSHEVAGQTLVDLSLHLAPADELSTLSLTYLGVRHELSYQLAKDSFRHFEAELHYKKSFIDLVLVDLEGKLSANRRDDSFMLTLTKGAESRSLIGNYGFDGEALSLSISQINVNGTPHPFALTLEANTLAALPEVPEYVNVIRIESSKYTPIHERMTAALDAWRAVSAEGKYTPSHLLAGVLSALGLEDILPSQPED